MSETYHRENKKTQDDGNGLDGNDLDENSDEYTRMDEIEIYAEVHHTDYDINVYSSQKDLANDTTSNILSQKKDVKNEVGCDCSSQEKVKWSLLSKNSTAHLLYAIVYLSLLVLVVILAAVILTNIGALESSIRNTTCNRSQTLSDFLGASQQQYCDLEKSKFRKYKIMKAGRMSCSEVLYQNSSAESGYYLLRSSTGQLTSVFCDMAKICGNITGGWMRVAELDVASCPAGLKSKVFRGIPTCVVNEDGPGCTSVLFSSFGIPFSKICGQIRGYGVGTVDGMYHNRWLRGGTINDNYLDGVSLSTGGSHVWSFVGGGCVCTYKKTFITNDWTCDQPVCPADGLCIDYLWNNSLCGENTPFLKHLPSATTNEINMRVCRDETRDNEDIALSNVELYVH